MRVTENLMAVERVIEKSLLGFFVLLGASEVPENWEPESQKITAQHTAQSAAKQDWQPPRHYPH